MFLTQWLLSQRLHPRLQQAQFQTHTAPLVVVRPDTNPALALHYVGLSPTSYQASMVIHSGMDNMGQDYQQKLVHFFNEGIAHFANDYNVLVADGGTESGGSQLMGGGRHHIQGKFPLVGVIVTERINPHHLSRNKPNTPDNRYQLNPYHSHFIAVEGQEFSAESKLLTGLACLPNQYGIALVVNGGIIVAQEAITHAQNNVPIIVFKGSGRFADELAASHPRSTLRRHYPRHCIIEVFDINQQTPAEFHVLCQQLLHLTNS